MQIQIADISVEIVKKKIKNNKAHKQQNKTFKRKNKTNKQNKKHNKRCKFLITNKGTSDFSLVFLFIFDAGFGKINSLSKSIFRFLAQNTGLYLRALN